METTIEVFEQSQVAEVRRVVAELARAQGMSAVNAGRAALVATEISTNLVKYATQGRVMVSDFSGHGERGIQLVALDKGPGFKSFSASSRDGTSTSGSLGIGLGAIMRASDVFDVFTQEAHGSALLSRIRNGPSTPPPAGALSVDARCTPKAGQTECGDAWSCTRVGRLQRVCLVDGLGHGPLAAQAARQVIAIFEAAGPDDSPADIITRCHEALKTTRGVVMGIVAIDAAAGTSQYAGVGNILGVVHTGGHAVHLLSVEGIVGYNMRTLRNHQTHWTENSVLILTSDGLSTRWNLSRHPGLVSRHPALIASVLYRDFARDTDDATVVVGKM